MRRLLLLFTTVFAAGPAAAQQAGSGNPVHDRLLTLPPAAQAQMLAKNVGQRCVGTAAFAMGVVNTAKSKSLAYWSLQCKDGRSFAIQIAPNAEAFVVDCRVLQANGKECFKKL